MSLRFAPLLPPTAIVVGVVIYLLLLVVLYRRLRPVLARRYWWILTTSKLVSLAAVLMLILNPYWVQQSPDDRTFRVAVLLDATASMNTKDCDDDSRLAVVRKQFLSVDSTLRQRLLSRYSKLQFYTFSGDQVRQLPPNTDLHSLPGDTDIDGALDRILASTNSDDAIGAVLVVSDGIDNHGQPLMAAARMYQKAGVPVHTLGVGNQYARHDIGVSWKTVPKWAVKGKPITLTGVVKRNFTGTTTHIVSLYDGGRTVAQVAVNFAENEKETEVSFEHTPFTAGFKTYKIHVAPLDDEHNRLNNVDFSGFEVRNPELFRAFYLNANLNWDYKFLRMLAETQEKLQIDAMIRLGETAYFVNGLTTEKAPLDGLPARNVINEYDCLIINLNSLYLLDDEDLDVINDFVENRGGGIIFTGVAENIPPRVQALMPIQEFPEVASLDPGSALRFVPTRVFSQTRSTTLKQLALKLTSPPNSTVYRLTPEMLKPAAIVAVKAAETPQIGLAVHNYGAGKVGFLNIADTWKWVMKLESGSRYFGTFWGQLIAWTSSASKERLTVRPSPGKLLLQRPVEFEVDVLSSDFTADNGATVVGRLNTPSGEESTITFFANPQIDGRYTSKFIPRESGEYRLSISASPTDGDALHTVSDYLAIDISPEAEPHPLDAGQLQSLARQTGGQYWHYTDASTITELPLSNRLNFTETQYSFASTWWFLLLLAAAILPDWILRRRIGLR